MQEGHLTTQFPLFAMDIFAVAPMQIGQMHANLSFCRFT